MTDEKNGNEDITCRHAARFRAPCLLFAITAPPMADAYFAAFDAATFAADGALIFHDAAFRCCHADTPCRHTDPHAAALLFRSCLRHFRLMLFTLPPLMLDFAMLLMMPLCRVFRFLPLFAAEQPRCRSICYADAGGPFITPL